MAELGREPASSSDKRESANALAVIGLGLLVADLLVIFFVPASLKVGRGSVFTVLIVVLAVVGLGLVILGRMQRRRVG